MTRTERAMPLISMPLISKPLLAPSHFLARHLGPIKAAGPRRPRPPWPSTRRGQPVDRGISERHYPRIGVDARLDAFSCGHYRSGDLTNAVGGPAARPQYGQALLQLGNSGRFRGFSMSRRCE